ncbi:3-deoxy-D-manno-octulosonic acid kinase [Coralloluteibacterium thermophilus]|uniref:3-deoxy-D-manno-octulosonic acid kinase n=1 Tax=Coralloluteibacterium thermophilum TaxID=2707049 RepID=A0ABV9NH45_9GAMM
MSVDFATEGLQPFRAERGYGAILFDPARVRQPAGELFDPAHWGERAEPVGVRGGRGSAWFLHDAGLGEAVLRHYRRGGLPARLVADRYWWHGANRTRSFLEFRLLAELRRLRLPVPAPLAAGYVRSGASYRADIIVERIPGTRSLAERQHDADAALWARVGGTLARFHRAGVDHADLNASNILVDAAGEVWLIDFDRGRRRPPASGWRERNLRRLRRSLLKLRGTRAVADVERDYRQLHAAYSRAWARSL